MFVREVLRSKDYEQFFGFLFLAQQTKILGADFCGIGLWQVVAKMLFPA